jgi:hypothetical protein
MNNSRRKSEPARSFSVWGAFSFVTGRLSVEQAKMGRQGAARMYENLEGRVMFETTDHGLRIAIPVRRGPFLAIYAPLVVIWLGLATVRYWNLLAGPHPEDINFDLQMIAIGVYVVGFLYFVCWLAWTMSGETVVILNPPTVEIQNCVFGFPLSTRTFQASQIHRIRFIPHTRIATQRSIINPTSSCIRFEVNKRSESFAKGVTEYEARALIDRMLLMYEFPRSWF